MTTHKTAFAGPESIQSGDAGPGAATDRPAAEKRPRMLLSGSTGTNRRTAMAT